MHLDELNMENQGLGGYTVLCRLVEASGAESIAKSSVGPQVVRRSAINACKSCEPVTGIACRIASLAGVRVDTIPLACITGAICCRRGVCYACGAG